MPTTTKQSYLIEERTFLPVCAGGDVLEDFGWHNTYSKTWSDAPPTPRPKPDEPLWKYPTAYPKVYTTEYNWPVEHLPLFQSGTTCYPRKPVFRENWNYAVVEGLQVALPTDLDWQTKMRLDIKDLSVNLGVAMAEFRQTASMFASFARSAKKGWDLFKGKSRARRKWSPCDVAAAELTASYGLEPLASDLYDSVEELNRVLEYPLIKRFVSTKRDNNTFSLQPGNGLFTGQWDVSERAILYVEFETNGGGGFTPGNPLELAWEVVPFSFVVDWAIPIGDYLSSLDALKGTKGVTGTVTRKERYTHTHVPYNSHVLGWDLESPGITNYRSFERNIVDSIPLPRVPRWEPSRSWRAITHGVSLLTTLNKGCDGKSRPFKPR